MPSTRTRIRNVFLGCNASEHWPLSDRYPRSRTFDDSDAGFFALFARSAMAIKIISSADLVLEWEADFLHSNRFFCRRQRGIYSTDYSDQCVTVCVVCHGIHSRIVFPSPETPKSHIMLPTPGRCARVLPLRMLDLIITQRRLAPTPPHPRVRLTSFAMFPSR